jgi:Flp pilus assembly protein TadG
VSGRVLLGLSDKATLFRGERGSVIVEAVLIIPVFVVLIFGVIEWSFVLRDEAAVSSAARTGVRIASIPPGPTSTNITQPTADAIQHAGSAMPKDNLEYILVYQANSGGFPLPDGNTTMTCAGAGKTCVKHTWSDSKDAFNRVEGEWDPDLINTCVGDNNAQSVGVYVKAKHPMITGFFGSTRDIDDSAVLRFEPRPKAVCKKV